jgi:hypothetical protein
LGPNASGQIPWVGDSGGPCVYTSAGVRYVVGVMSAVRPDKTGTKVGSCEIEAASNFRDWVNTSVGSGPHGGAMRNGNEYRLFTNAVSWAQADADCRSRRGHLATFTSPPEQSFIMGSVIGYASYATWVGLTDAGHEGTWTWVTGEPASSLPWNYGQPDNAGGAENWAEVMSGGGLTDQPATATAPYVCEWEAHGGAMYGGHEYLGFSPNRSWTEAQYECAAIGGSLVTITSSAENGFVASILPSKTHNWIGFSDAGHEGTWTWATGEPVSFKNWNTGEPNNSGGAENWAEMVGSGRWNDLPATWRIPYVCEWPARTP